MCAYVTKKDLTEELGGLHKKVGDLAKEVKDKVAEVKDIVVKVAEVKEVIKVPPFSEEEVKAIAGAFGEVFDSLARLQRKIVEAGLVVDSVINPKLGLLRLSVCKGEAVEEKEAEAKAEGGE